MTIECSIEAIGQEIARLWRTGRDPALIVVDHRHLMSLKREKLALAAFAVGQAGDADRLWDLPIAETFGAPELRVLDENAARKFLKARAALATRRSHNRQELDSAP